MKDVKSAFPNQLKTGRVIVVDIMSTSSLEQSRLQLAQQVEGNTNAISAMQGTPQVSILNAWIPIKNDVLNAKGIKAGDILEDKFRAETKNQPFNIQITERQEPFTYVDGQGFPRVLRNAKMNKTAEQGGEYLLKDGKHIYRSTSLQVGKVDHVKVTHDATTSIEPDYDAMEDQLTESVAENAKPALTVN